MSAAPKKADSIDQACNWLGTLPAPDPAGFSVIAAGMLRTAAMNVHFMEAILQASRRMIDASRALLRQQQDAALQAWREQIEAAVSTSETEQSDVLAPFAVATRAAVDMSAAILQAQRGAVQALSEQARSH